MTVPVAGRVQSLAGAGRLRDQGAAVRSRPPPPTGLSGPRPRGGATLSRADAQVMHKSNAMLARAAPERKTPSLGGRPAPLGRWRRQDGPFRLILCFPPRGTGRKLGRCRRRGWRLLGAEPESPGCQRDGVSARERSFAVGSSGRGSGPPERDGEGCPLSLSRCRPGPRCRRHRNRPPTRLGAATVDEAQTRTGRDVEEGGTGLTGCEFARARHPFSGGERCGAPRLQRSCVAKRSLSRRTAPMTPGPFVPSARWRDAVSPGLRVSAFGSDPSGADLDLGRTGCTKTCTSQSMASVRSSMTWPPGTAGRPPAMTEPV